MRTGVKGLKDYIEARAQVNQVNNTGVGKVVALTKDGRHTVEIDGGKQIMVYSATGSPYAVGDTVSIRYGSDPRQAEIAGKSTRRLATTTKTVWV